MRTYTYNGDGLESITDIAGRTTTFEADYGVGWIIRDPYNRATYLNVDSAGRLTSVIQPDPNGAGPLAAPVTSYEYYASGTESNLLKSITDARGLATTIEYDPTRHVSEITERCGGSIQIDSIPAQLYVDPASTDPNNLATLTPANLLLTEAIDTVKTTEHRVVYGNDQYITRNANSDITSMTDALGNVTQYSYYRVDKGIYEDFGRLESVAKPDPDGEGSLTTLTTTFYYGDSDNPAALQGIVYTDDKFDLWDYGDFGQVASYTDRNGNVTSYGINEDTGNIETKIQWTGTEYLTTAYTYTDEEDDTILGLVETVEDPNGNVTHYTYNSLGQVETVVYAEGTADEVTEEYAYDAFDRLESMTDGRGNVTEYEYDNLDRLIERTDPDPDDGGSLESPVWQYFYDKVGNQTHVVDPLGHVTETVYDVWNRPFQTIQPVADPSATPSVVTKEGTSGVTLVGSWTSVSATGAIGGSESGSTGNGASYTYAFTGLTAGKKYAVEFRWTPAAGTHDANALFEVFGNTSNDPLNSLHVNLNASPQGLPDGSGFMWQSVGTFSPYSNTLTVKLRDDDSNGKLLLDAVRLVEVGPVTQTDFDCNGNLVETTDPLGRVTEYEYDDLNRLVTRIDPDPDGSGMTYEMPKRITRTIRSAG